MSFKNIPCMKIFPEQDDGSDDASDSSSEGEDSATGEEKVIAEFCQVSDTGGGGTLGDWERHTKVGSKLILVIISRRQSANHCR